MNPVREVTTNLDWQDAIARSVVYSFLSRAIAYPEPAQLGVLRERIIPAVLELEPEGPIGDAFREGFVRFNAPVDSLRAWHTSLFSLTVSSDCPDYETAYLSRDIFQQTQVMADVAGFYRAYGLEVGGQRYQRPDHIATELEFMGFLAHKEAYAIQHLTEEEQAMAREGQVLFLRDHLACWGPALGRRITSSDGGGESPYGPIGTMLTAWLIDECEHLGIEPSRSVDEPVLEWPEPDDGTCGIDAECPAIGTATSSG